MGRWRTWAALLCGIAAMLANVRGDGNSRVDAAERADGAANAQGEEQTPAGSQESAASVENLEAQQKAIRDRVARLEDRMFELSQALRKTEPEKAARLLEALGAARGMRIRERMDEIVSELKSTRYSDAAESQEAVSADLQALLKKLLEEPDQLDERQEEIDRLEKLKDALKGVIQEQEQEKAASDAAIAREQLAAAVAAAAEQIRAVRTAQQDLAARGPGADAPGPSNAAAQGELADQTEKLKRQVAELAEAVRELERAAQGATTKPEQESGLPGATEIESATGNLENALGQMRKAAEELGRGTESSGAAELDQRGAERELGDAIEKLESQSKRLRNILRLEEEARAQRATAEKTKKLADSMKGSSSKGSKGAEGGEGGKSGEGQGKSEGSKSGKSGDSSEAGPKEDSSVPGSEDVQDAVPFQEDAADGLENKDAKGARQDQEDALKRLQQARNQLEDTLEQLRKEQQEEMLAALEARFRAMLAKQLDCQRATERLADLGAARWTRSDQLELGRISGDQGWVGEQAAEAAFIFKEEGSTIVFPQILEQVRDDARVISERIAAADIGPIVRANQLEIAELLEQMIEAVRKKQKEMQDGGSKSGGGGGQGGARPLLPGSAELKLLRSCQLRVNRATEQLEGIRVNQTLSGESLRIELERLSIRQEHVAKMARQMHESLTKAQ